MFKITNSKHSKYLGFIILVKNGIEDRAEYLINTMNRHNDYMANLFFVTE